MGASLAARAGNGGHAWTRISLVRGLERLGFDVLLIEEVDSATDEQRSYFERVCADFCIAGAIVAGPADARVLDRANAAALVLNVGGNLTLDKLGAPHAVKIYLDDDPGYTQLWHDEGLIDARLAGHDIYFTFGANVGRAGCDLPVDGIQWRATRPAVGLDDWPVMEPLPLGFSTVASWRGGYGRVEHRGKLYGQKAHEFRRFAPLPQVVAGSFEIALQIDADDAADAELMRGWGWVLVDPNTAASSPAAFRDYVQGSAAEFSVAQGIYVETACGWFSDRTTRYLASGRPALVQDCGFSSTIPAGEGLVAFTTIAEAAAGAEAIAENYDAHARAARAIAEEYFDSDRVLGSMLAEAGL